jgi:O-antigen/teichoic acid export membrane protein
MRGSAWNFIGMVVGTLISFVGYPLLVRGLGTERFGVSSIAGAVVGYFMVFDLGLARASIVVLGEALEKRQERRISGLFWSGQALMFLLGTLGASALACAAPYLCRSVLHIPPGLVHESIWGLTLVSLSIPLMIVFSAQLGLLGNLGRFGYLNTARTLMNVLTWVAPLVALHFQNDLISVFGAMLAGRALTIVFSLTLCLVVEPSIRRPRFASWLEIVPLVRQGGWMTITNLVSPLMTYMDRMLLGALASLSAVTYYAVAGDTSQKLMIFQASIVGALFPLLPGMLAADRESAMAACRSAFHLLVITVLPLVLVASAFGDLFLVRWIGPDVGGASARPFLILLLGVFINSFAHIPFSLLTAEGRARYAALLHLVELPFFLVLLYLLVPSWGASGAAIAWTIRVVFDTAVMGWGGRSPFVGTKVWRQDSRWIGVTCLVLLAGCFPTGAWVRRALDMSLLLAWVWVCRTDLFGRIRAVTFRLLPGIGGGHAESPEL